MTTRAVLAGRLTLGGGSVDFNAALGGGPTILLGSLGRNQRINFHNLIEDLTAGRVDLPDWFPDLSFDMASAQLQLGDVSSLSLTAGSTASWPMKIGFFNGVTITNWALTLTTGSSYTSFGFSVGAQFGGTEVDGYLRFDGDQFEVIGFGIEGTLSIGDLLTRIGVAVSWGDLLPISFDPIPPNAAMRLYYAADNWTDPDNGSVYVKGVNFDWCRITIFGAKADVSASIDSNVTVTGGLPEPLNLGILALTGETAQGRGAKGPSLIASTANGGSFTLAAGVAFCGSPFADTPVTIAKNSDGQYQFSGSITYTGDDLPITPPPISFVWDEKNGFQVTAWSHKCRQLSSSKTLDGDAFTLTLPYHWNGQPPEG